MVTNTLEKQELSAVYFGDEWQHVLHRIMVAPKGGDPWFDDYIFTVHSTPVPGSEGIDTCVLNNARQLIDARERGLLLNDSMGLVWHWLNKHDIAYRLPGPKGATRLAIHEDCRVSILLAPPTMAEAA